MTLPTLLAFYVLAMGLIVGSYLNVVIYRLPRELSTAWPRSHCPGCGNAIAARDNVPLLSFLLLRGRCRFCRTPIAWRYPAIEALTALLFLLCFWRFGPSLETAAACLFSAALVALAVIDLEHFLLPDQITLPGTVVGLALAPWLDWGGAKEALIGAGLGALVLLAMTWGWRLVRGEEGMGLGDVKMLAMIGAFLGWKGTLVTLLLASASGAMVGLALLGRGGAGWKTRLPFGFFLAAAGMVCLFFGQPLAERYLALL